MSIQFARNKENEENCGRNSLGRSWRSATGWRLLRPTGRWVEDWDCCAESFPFSEEFLLKWETGWLTIELRCRDCRNAIQRWIVILAACEQCRITEGIVANALGNWKLRFSLLSFSTVNEQWPCCRDCRSIPESLQLVWNVARCRWPLSRACELSARQWRAARDYERGKQSRETQAPFQRAM